MCLQWGEIDTRFSYCAFSCLAILGRLQTRTDTTGSSRSFIDAEAALNFVSLCQNFDGGFGAVPGAESHAGQIFCCVACLSIGQRLDLVDRDLLSWWLSERQCDSGGLNGRPEKQADVCYSWWILSSLTILGRLDWIDTKQLGRFILQCQDETSGGIADRPGNMADIFHTYFGVAGLCLLNYLTPSEEQRLLAISSSEVDARFGEPIDPTYALPVRIVAALHGGAGLPAQKLPHDLI